MARSPRDELDHELDVVDTAADDPDDPLTDSEAAAITEWAQAVDSTYSRPKFIDADDQIVTLETTSIGTYVPKLRLAAQRGLGLESADAAAVNDWIDDQFDDRGLARTTLAIYQCALRSFYRYHDFAVDPEGIHVYSEQSAPRHDEQDMFSERDVEALREACNSPRDRALLEMLIYTGQRINALLTLRIKDIDLEHGQFFLNDDAEGLKGALGRGRKRPLLGARKYVRDWLEYHPYGSDPDSPLFVPKPGHAQGEEGVALSYTGAYRRLKEVGKRAGVTKPTNPHNFRHYFVTVMKRDYSMDSDTLRMLLGTAVDSTVLDTTYAHVSNDEYVEKAESITGYRDVEEETSPLTPDACATCGELLEDHWKQCPACGETYAPELERYEAQADRATDEAFDELAERMNDLSPAEIQAFRGVLDALDDPVSVDERVGTSD